MNDLRTRIRAAIQSVGTIDTCCADLAAKAVIRELKEKTADYCLRCGRPHSTDECLRGDQ